MEIKTLINSKIKEHEDEIEKTLIAQEQIKANLESVQKKGVHALMLESNKMLVLKDKILVHKSAVLTLKDLLGEI